MSTENEYTPTTGDADMRAIIVSFAENTRTLAEEFGETGTATPDEVVAGFDCWLAAHDAEVAAKALEDAADALTRITLRGPDNRTKHASSVQDIAVRVVRARAAALWASTGGEV